MVLVFGNNDQTYAIIKVYQEGKLPQVTETCAVHLLLYMSWERFYLNVYIYPIPVF